MLEWDCVRCEEPTTIAKSQPVNKEKPFDKRKCNPCCSTDRTLQRRKLMDNFKKKEASEKKAYYLERKHSTDPNAVINALVTSQREDEYNKREVTENDNSCLSAFGNGTGLLRTLRRLAVQIKIGKMIGIAFWRMRSRITRCTSVASGASVSSQALR